MHTSPGSTPVLLRWHCGGAGKFGHCRKASQVLSTPLKICGHHRCLQMKHHEHAPKPSGGGSRHWGVALQRQACGCAIYLGPGAPLRLQRCFGDVPDGWAMFVRLVYDGTEVALQCSFYRWRLQCYPPAIARC